MLLENLMDFVLYRTQGITMLRTDEGDTHEVGKLGEILWFVGLSLHCDS